MIDMPSIFSININLPRRNLNEWASKIICAVSSGWLFKKSLMTCAAPDHSSKLCICSWCTDSSPTLTGRFEAIKKSFMMKSLKIQAQKKMPNASCLSACSGFMPLLEFGCNSRISQVHHLCLWLDHLRHHHWFRKNQTLHELGQSLNRAI